MSEPVSRRDFVADSTKLALGALIAPPMIVPRHVLGRGYRAPSDTLGVAVVGAGGMGMANMEQVLGERLVAVCDVDFPYVERALAGRLRPRNPELSAEVRARLTPEEITKAEAERRVQEAARMEQMRKLEAAYRPAAKYADFRQMLERQRDIDAVIVATPDHLHAVIASAAMKAGKHVYVQKPLTYSVHEARALARTAAETRVVTQMGNQGHSMEGTRRIRELVASGLLGPVREVHVWTDRPFRYWAQGIPRPGTPRPAPTAPADPNVPPQWNVRTVEQAVLKAMEENRQTPPPGLDWNLYLGPAREVPYHPAYHPFAWRGWVDFGVSAIGDMGAHLLDQPYWALDLGLPTSFSASSTAWGGPADNPASYPMAMTAEYEFPARDTRPAVRLHWYDGGLMPPRPRFLPDDVTLPRGDGGGGVFVGERGILTYETYGNNPTVYPASLAAEAERVPKSVPRIEGSHEMNWVNACKGQGEASSPFAYAGPLTEVMLLPIVALRAGQGRKLQYDAPAMRVTNVPEANQWLTREYRAGWSL
jgi:predicted dehydrogenase